MFCSKTIQNALIRPFLSHPKCFLFKAADDLNIDSYTVYGSLLVNSVGNSQSKAHAAFRCHSPAAVV